MTNPDCLMHYSPTALLASLVLGCGLVALSGAEWLAAAGAAYALNRLHKEGSDDEEEPSED